MVVIQIQRRPRVGSQGLIGMRTQPQKLQRRCEVTAILVLYGLPRYSFFYVFQGNFFTVFFFFYIYIFPNGCRLLTGAILAHELMHAWLRLRGKDKLRYGKEVSMTTTTNL